MQLKKIHSHQCGYLLIIRHLANKNYIVFTLHKLNRSFRSTTVLGASVNAFLPFCSVPFRSVPLKNGTVKFAVRERSERSFSFIAISSV